MANAWEKVQAAWTVVKAEWGKTWVRYAVAFAGGVALGAYLF